MREHMLLLGLVYQKEGETAIAERQFVKSLKLDPSFTRGERITQPFLYAQGRFQEAFNEFKWHPRIRSFPRGRRFFQTWVCVRSNWEKKLLR